MSYKNLLDDDTVRQDRLTTADRSTRVVEVMGIAERELADAQAEGISTERRHNGAYEAVRSASEAMMSAEGVRTGRKMGHHAAVIEFLRVTENGRWLLEAGRFEDARKKRNESQYDRSGAITDTEADELLEAARHFVREVKEWLREKGILPEE